MAVRLLTECCAHSKLDGPLVRLLLLLHKLGSHPGKPDPSSTI